MKDGERERERDCSKEVNPADRQELARAYRAMMSLTESPWRQEIRGPSRMTSCNLARHSTSEGGLLVPVGGMSCLAQRYNPTIPNTLPNPVCVCVCVCVPHLLHSLTQSHYPCTVLFDTNTLISWAMESQWAWPSQLLFQ